tara:strand:+ start:48 stop:338 length:291 start_codon:yes stop_codon:yes gene_type:complete
MFLKSHIYYALENSTAALGPKIRKMGQAYYQRGLDMQGNMGHEDTMQPSLRCVPISNSKYPRAVLSDWIAPNAVLIGDVTTKEGSSVWHGATLRGD